MALFSIDPNTNIGSTHLTVADLARSERFYTSVLGFRPLTRTNDTLTLTADGATPLLALTELPGAPPKPARATGLYHFAILTPSRLDLARSLRRLAEMRYPLSGASDHLVSEALYLDDPDGNGIEIYRDRPRAEWPRPVVMLQLRQDAVDVERIGRHPDLAARPRPLGARAVAVDLDPVAVGVVQVERLADQMVGCAR